MLEIEMEAEDYSNMGMEDLLKAINGSSTSKCKRDL